MTMQYITTSHDKWEYLKPLARKNRYKMTFAEKIVWLMLRKNQLGVKFRRQQVIADYIVDFVCLEIMLVIEIDGDSHDEKKEYDSFRTNVLNELGYKVIRFSNEEVIGNGNLVELAIINEIQKYKTESPQHQT
jgi:very-short-patch-repair endonuclease